MELPNSLRMQIKLSATNATTKAIRTQYMNMLGM